MSTQPEALRLADAMLSLDAWNKTGPKVLMEQAAAELRRLSAVNAELMGALRKITRTMYHIETPPIESLEEQMRNIARAAIAKAGGAA